MSGATTTRMLRAYNQQPENPTLFFTGMFDSPPQNFHNTEKVEFDITRSEEDIAIVVTDLSSGYRMDAAELFTNKSFKPPIYKQAVPVKSHDLIKRVPGATPFENPDFRANLITRVFGVMRKVESKIKRSIELQAAQVLQTGSVILRDENGTPLYELSFVPKASHFPTASTSWASAGGQAKIDDVRSLTEQVRNDGLAKPDELIFGENAFENFFSDSVVRSRFDIRRIDQGTVSRMEMRGNGGIYRGIVEIGNYRYDVWTYGGYYKDPQTLQPLPYMHTGKVIVRSSMARLDLTFGAIPNIGRELNAQGTNMLPELPARMSDIAGGVDLHTNVWLTNDGETLFAGVGARPLTIPTAIDTFGCLDTQLT